MNGTAKLLLCALAVGATLCVCRAEDRPPAGDWPMLGGTPSRNMANPAAQQVPDLWSVKEGARKNVRWVAELGSTSYGGPVIAGGRVFVGTNNGQPRDASIQGDKGVLMCFRES